MQFNLKKLKDAEAELKISLDKADLDGYVKKAMENLRTVVKADGYRKGKVPDNILRQNVGDEMIKEEALDLSVQTSLKQVVKEQKLEILEYHELEIKKNTPELLEFQVKLLMFPKVELGDYHTVKVEAKPISVNDTDVEKTLEDIRKTRTTFIPSEEPVREGDRVEVDFEVKENGQLIEGGKSENHPILIGKGGFMPGFEEQLKGMKAGESKSFAIKAPEDYYQKSIAGKSLDFDVTMKKVEQSQLPELTGEFIKGLGNFNDLAQLTQSIQDGILQEKEIKEAERIKLAIIDKILEGAKFELPQVLIDRQLDLTMNNFDKELHDRGMEMGLYLAHIGKKQEDLRKGFIPQAEKQVKIDLVLHEVGKLEGIVVTNQEIDDRLSELNSAINLQDELAQKDMNMNDLRSRVGQILFTDKVFEYLVRHALVK